VPHDAGGVEEHRETLPVALRMPDDGRPAGSREFGERPGLSAPAMSSPPATPCAVTLLAFPLEYSSSAVRSSCAIAPPTPPRQTNPAPLPVHRAQFAPHTRQHKPNSPNHVGARLRQWIR
jgi:hypothetical protein